MFTRGLHVLGQDITESRYFQVSVNIDVVKLEA